MRESPTRARRRQRRRHPTPAPSQRGRTAAARTPGPGRRRRRDIEEIYDQVIERLRRDLLADRERMGDVLGDLP